MTFSEPDGATPLDDISDLKIPWVQDRSDLNRVEAENISEALNKHLLCPIAHPTKWCETQIFQKIHYDMFCDVWDWAGKFRKTQTSIGVKAYTIPTELKLLCEEVHYWCSEDCDLSLFEQAVRFHHKLVFIHPFSNGNGRFARLLSDRYLKAFDCTFPTWPRDLDIKSTHRNSYIAALKDADIGNYETLQIFFKDHGAKAQH